MKVKLKHRRLAEELAKSPLSLNRWAQKMGLSSGHLSELVNGKKVCPRPETRQRILRALKIPFEELFEVELHRPPSLVSGRRGFRPPSSLEMVPCAPASRGRSMRNIARDLRQAARQLGRRPLFSVAVILTLSIGIGANTALFSIVDTILWKPFPYMEPERLVDLSTTSPRRPRGGNLSYPDYLDYRQSNTVFTEMAAHDWEPYSLSDESEAIRVGGGRVTASLFPLLGIEPLLGRTFSAEEDRPGGEPVVLLGEGLWRSHFGSDPAIVGQSVQINGQPRTVIGVMPAQAEYPERARLWVPLAYGPETLPRNARGLQVTARLRPGVSMQQAQAALEPLARSLEEKYPETNRERGILLTTLRQTRTEDAAAPSLLLLGVTAFVLLIVCANVSNLVLARGLSRERELAIRTALGAGRGDVIRQLLSENLLLAAAGGALGLILGAWGAQRLMGMIPFEMPAWLTIETDARVALFSLGASLAALLFFGLLPTLSSARQKGGHSLKEGGLQSTASRARRRIRSLLVVSEVALAMVLLAGAGLMFKSLSQLAAIDSGLRPQGVLVAGMDLLAHLNKESEERIAVFERFLHRLEAIPGVEAVGAVDRIPLGRSQNSTRLSAEGQTEEQARSNPQPIFQSISPGYFQAMGIPVFRGQTFPERPGEGVLQAIVSQKLGQALWPGQDALGKRFKFGSTDSESSWREVIAVVGDVRHEGIQQEPEPIVYLPYQQSPLGRMSWALRTSGDPLRLAAPLRQAVREVDPHQPLHNVMTLQELIDQSFWDWRFFSYIFWIFAAIALLLASLGIYGVMAYSVSERTQEMGIRLALGARPVQVVRHVLRQGLGLIALGLLIGLPVGLALGQLLSSILFGVRAFEPGTYLVASLTLTAVALCAILLPARRASRIDPIRALRYE